MEVLGKTVTEAEMKEQYPAYFVQFISTGLNAGRLDPRLAEFDLKKIGNAIKPERDAKFQYLGLQTLYDRYLLHKDGRRYELPQAFWMRIAMDWRSMKSSAKSERLNSTNFSPALILFLPHPHCSTPAPCVRNFHHASSLQLATT